MLETLDMPSYLQGENAMDSSVTAPDNQQGRVVKLARLAGIIDCEGTAYFNRRVQGENRITYAPVIRVVNSDQAIVDEVAATLGDLGIDYNRLDDQPTYEGYGDVSTISMYGIARVLKLIGAIKPYITAKARVFDLIEQFCARRRGAVRGSKYTKRDYDLVRAVRAVNSEGTSRDIPLADHLELVGPSRVARLDDIGARAKLAAIVECDGHMGLTNLRNGKYYMPSIQMYSSSDAFIAEIRQSLASLGLAYYYISRPPRGIQTKPQGEFHIQGMKRAKRFLDATAGCYRAYAERAKVLNLFISHRLSLPANTPYSRLERDLKDRIDWISTDRRLPSTTARKIDECLWHRRKIQSALHGDMQKAAEMTASVKT